MTKVRTPTSTGLGLIAVMKAIMASQYQVGELAEMTGLKNETVSKYLHMLHRAGLAYIAGYGCTTAGWRHSQYKLWAWGNHKDAPRPTKQTRRQRYLRDRERRTVTAPPPPTKRVLERVMAVGAA